MRASPGAALPLPASVRSFRSGVMRCAWSRCDAQCCGGVFAVRWWAYASLVGVVLTLLGCLGCYIVFMTTLVPKTTCLATELGTLNEYGARVAGRTHADAYSPALWAVASGCRHLDDPSRRASCFEWGMFSESVWPTAAELGLLDYLPLLVLACPLITAIFCLISSLCGLRRDGRVRTFCCMKTFCALPNLYPFWLLLSVGIFVVLGVGPVLWSTGAAPEEWAAHVTASAQWNCEQHGDQLQLPIDTRSPAEHYELSAGTAAGGAGGLGAMSTATRLQRWAETYAALAASSNASAAAAPVPPEYAGADELPRAWERACRCFFSLEPTADSVGGEYPTGEAMLFLPGLAPSGLLGLVGVLLLWYTQAAMCCAAGCCCVNPTAAFDEDEDKVEAARGEAGAPSPAKGRAASDPAGILSPATTLPNQSV